MKFLIAMVLFSTTYSFAAETSITCNIGQQPILIVEDNRDADPLVKVVKFFEEQKLVSEKHCQVVVIDDVKTPLLSLVCTKQDDGDGVEVTLINMDQGFDASRIMTVYHDAHSSQRRLIMDEAITCTGFTL